MECSKCGAISGDSWTQCGGQCPIVASPHHGVLDMNGERIRVGDKVKMYDFIGADLKLNSMGWKEGCVISLSTLNKPEDADGEMMVWCAGYAAHHPQACEIMKETDRVQQP